ncbi:unnamed protein product [Didymodactylos carnosus]|uniref:RING-type domain-containing protein n=1 Tax=Didymodactylos carnosus TaxID=1234261 RepID=A0A8S2H7D5_9BILA|nr:unnamed protein product [Didymodactylos carnosus]CAF3609369.1 unnamed protein product [Didymodactylos carnosus]
MRRMIQHDRSNRVRRPNGNNVRNLQQFQGDFSSEDYETLLQLDEITGANKQKLNKNQINQISTDKFNKSSSSQSASSEENTCSICYDNFEDGQTLHIYPCIHKFHQDCSSRWLSENNVCPVCRLPPVTVENTARRTIHRSHNRPHQTNNNTSRRN